MRAEEFRAAQAAAMSEDQLLRAIVGNGSLRSPGLAGTLGWLGYHTHRSDRSPAGFPDLVLVRRGRLIFAELKRQDRKAKPTPAQDAWLDELELVTRHVEHDAAWSEVAWPDGDNGPAVGVYLWRPEDLLDGSIESILR